MPMRYINTKTSTTPKPIKIATPVPSSANSGCMGIAPDEADQTGLNAGVDADRPPHCGERRQQPHLRDSREPLSIGNGSPCRGVARAAAAAKILVKRLWRNPLLGVILSAARLSRAIRHFTWKIPVASCIIDAGLAPAEEPLDNLPGGRKSSMRDGTLAVGFRNRSP